MIKNYIVVFGGCSLDSTYIEKNQGGYNDVPTISVPGGKGANQAVAAARAGAHVKLISRLGKDKIGEEIINNLQTNNVDTSCIDLESGLNNDACKIFVSKEGENDIHRVTGAIDSFTPEMVEKYGNIIKNAKFVIAQMKAPKEVSVKLINYCFAHKVPIVVTPCRPERLSIADKLNQELIDKITYITCNEKEAKIVFNCDNVEDIVKKYPNKVIVTLGEKGAIFNDGKNNILIPAFKTKHVVDTTGAGDTLCGNFVVALLNGNSIKESVFKGMAASTIKIQQKTAQQGMPYKKELEAFIKSVCKCKHNGE